MFTTERAEKYRRKHPLGFESKPGDPFGFFVFRLATDGPILRVQASGAWDKFEFDHVSVSLARRTPTWEEMCQIKDLFWDAEDLVVQYHPPKSEYVNLAKTCLHLWCWTKGDMPKPQKIEVGI